MGSRHDLSESRGVIGHVRDHSTPHLQFPAGGPLKMKRSL